MSVSSYTQRNIAFRNNFGAIRYILCFAIFLSHFNVLTGSHLWFPITGYIRVCGFFVMSGFLIYGSYFRSDGCRDYLRNRAWRILPSYLLTVVLCAILLVFVSDCSPREYFTSPQWFKYLIANALSLNFIEPELPGVFSGHTISAVNGSLWTMKVEWLLYLFIIPVIWVTKRYHLKFWKVYLTILTLSIVYKLSFGYLYETTGRNLYHILERQIGGQLAFFYSGVFLYMYLDRLKRIKWPVAVICAVILLVGINLFDDVKIFSHILFPMSLAGFVVAIAFIGRWGLWAEMFENCSYEIYLFHFPAIQLAVHFRLTERFGSGITFCVLLAAVVALSYLVARYISAPLRRSHRSHKRISNAEVMLTGS